MMSPSQYASLLAENKVLKARILSMKRQSDDGDNRTFEMLQNSASTSSVASTLDDNPDFSVIRAKLRMAEAEAKVTREYYNSLKAVKNEPKPKYDQFMFKSTEVSLIIFGLHSY
jgi:cell division septum initiation protein DivIVA